MLLPPLATSVTTGANAIYGRTPNKPQADHAHTNEYELAKAGSDRYGLQKTGYLSAIVPTKWCHRANGRSLQTRLGGMTRVHLIATPSERKTLETEPWQPPVPLPLH